MVVAKYECKLCNKKVNNLKRHCLAVHSGLRPYKCKYCDKSFNDTSSIGRHHRLHESKDIKSFVCKLCNKKFTSIEYLRIHEKSHLEAPFECEICHIKIKGKYHFKEHVKAHSDTTSNKTTCHLCDKTFKGTYRLNLHLQGFHNKGERISCTQCSTTFKNKGYLGKHMKYIHSKKEFRKWKCDTCSKHFSQQGPLIVHKRTHTGERLECSLCEATFAAKHNLKYHLAYTHSIGMHQTNFTCKVCNRSFTRKLTLQHHILTHIGLKQHLCDFCDYKATTKENLRRHLKTCRKHIVVATQNISKI